MLEGTLPPLTPSRAPGSARIGSPVRGVPSCSGIQSLEVGTGEGVSKRDLIRHQWVRLLLVRLQRRAEANALHRRDHLLDGDLGGVEGHDRFLRLEADVRPIHALQPFQGLLDRDGSGPSRHSINGEDDGRGRRHPDVHGDHEAE